ncbi:hypothetical protein COT27_01585 [Candidatus Kuenenbacteria bacterium CG08_land_8_20_14_0_20_37_23]|uniref:Uncharacterized protein n=1 Tax=Candidatus Kuenenbacteria bacterium CG08_land_8_20_14_0_20_37_23 TaxID=1974617 RepID=A0A2M6XSW8_9BACT|nr:MAG: hypothetical protein COT27_01585 [Candidatus Kuenenbacteria bacterium CG08_land_8_20_14_0_20_37_23]
MEFKTKKNLKEKSAFLSMEGFRKHSKKIIVAVGLSILCVNRFDNNIKEYKKFGCATKAKTENVTKGSMIQPGSQLEIDPGAAIPGTESDSGSGLDPDNDELDPTLFTNHSNKKFLDLDMDNPKTDGRDADGGDSLNENEKKSGIKTAGNKDGGSIIPEKEKTSEKITSIQKLKNSIPGLVKSGDVLSVSDLNKYLQENEYLDESGSLNPGSGLSQEQLDELIKYFENDISDYQKVSGWVEKYVDLNKISVDSDDKTGEKTFTVSLNERSTFKFRTGPDSRRFSFTEGGNAIRTLDGIKNNYANEIGADLTIFGILREILLKKLNLTI